MLLTKPLDPGLPDVGLLLDAEEPPDTLVDEEPRSGVEPLMRVSESAADQRGDFPLRGVRGEDLVLGPGVDGRDLGEDGGVLMIAGREKTRSAWSNGVARTDLAPLEEGSSGVLKPSRLRRVCDNRASMACEVDASIECKSLIWSSLRPSRPLTTESAESYAGCCFISITRDSRLATSRGKCRLSASRRTISREYAP